MIFNEQSIIVKTWARLVQSGKYTRDQVPDIGNLKDVVHGILDQPVTEPLIKTGKC